MWLIIAFAPVLVFLPLLLVAMILLVAVPGLLIIVLGAGFYGSLALFGVVAEAARTWRDAAPSRAPRDDTSSAPGRLSLPAGVRAPALQPVLRGQVIGGPARRVAAAPPLQTTAEDRAAQRRLPPAA